jgi:zinc transport system permease protein
MIDILGYPFMQRALIGGLLVGFLASYFGPLVVQRNMAFLGSGLAHAAFAGVALGMVLGIQPLLVAAPYTVALAIAIIWAGDHAWAWLSADTIIGVFFAASMAVGIILLSFAPGYGADPMTFLFGDLLAVTAGDLWITLLVTLLSVATFPFWSRWAYATFDRQLATADRLPVQREDYLLGVCLALTVVVAIKVVGILLIAAFLVLPAAIARLFARRFAHMTLLSVLIGMGTVVAGLFLSYPLDLPSSPLIILVQTALFFTALLLRRRPS